MSLRRSYFIGFIGSVVLTLGAYWLATTHLATNHTWPSDRLLAWLVIGIALVQLAVQLRLFLHVGDEAKPRWKLMILLFAGLVVLVVVIGSIWIMNNLNYHMGTPDQTNSAIMIDEGIHK